MQIFLNGSKCYIYIYLFGNNSKAQVIFRQNFTYRKWTQVRCKCLSQKQTRQKPWHELAIPVWQINIPSSFQYLMARMQLYKQSTARSPAEQRSWKTALMEAGGLPWSRGIPKCCRADDLVLLHTPPRGQWPQHTRWKSLGGTKAPRRLLQASGA